MSKIFCIIFLALLLPISAHAAAGPWQRDADIGARLVSGVDGTGSETTIPLGLELDMAEGWHTYWRSPGMAGLPPQIDWSHSETNAGNLQSAALLYPAPRRYSAFGLETIGYRGHVIFPVDAIVKKPGQDLRLDAQVALLLCSSVCVPKNVALTLTVPAGPAGKGAEGAGLDAARKAVPVTSPSTLHIDSVRQDGRNVVVIVTSDHPLQAPDMFVENGADIQFSAPIVAVDADEKRAAFTLTPSEELPAGKTLAGLELVLTVVSAPDAMEARVVVPAAGGEGVTNPPSNFPPLPGLSNFSAVDHTNPSSLEGAGGGGAVTPTPLMPIHTTLLLALLLALAGGFILNLMPCVLPVLSLKVLGIAKHGGGDIARIRRSFLASAAGIIASFLALAGMTLALKALGLSLGWGVQFQQPVFLTFLILLLVLFAANLWGFYEIPLPRFLADNLDAGPAVEPDRRKTYRPQLAGDFATGALATLLATPCSAPFLGTAVGFALASGPVEIVLVFLALGLGMSLPYLAVAALPRLAALLPRPGGWMLRLRQLLGGALALTAAWLLWVLVAEVPLHSAALVGGSMLGVIGLLALPHEAISRSWRRALILLCACFALTVALDGALTTPSSARTDAQWQKFSEAGLAQNLANGKTVFVDVTADWCLTCKANRRFILTQPDIEARLFGGTVVPLQADWTRPDPAVAAFLHRHERFGIPFNAVFGPNAPQGSVLPELLTHDAVMQALDKASAR